MKRTLLTLSIFVLTISAFAQVTDKEKDLKSQNTDTVYGWRKGALINLSFSQVALVNWAAGGVNSISGNGIANLYGNYVSEKIAWENSLDLGYGILKNKDAIAQKTDDKLEFTSKIGSKAKGHWYYSGLLNFRTQFTNGVEDGEVISKFMAPGYFIGALGMDYKPSKNFTAFISPITEKMTFVLDDVLANAGAFGVDAAVYNNLGQLVTAGKKTRYEFGGYARAMYTKDVMKNVKMTTNIALFSNYLENPQNIDVNWELLVLMKVNKYITVSINTNLIYDHDIVISRDTNNDGNMDVNGPRTQFKEVLGVGFSYKL